MSTYGIALTVVVVLIGIATLFLISKINNMPTKDDFKNLKAETSDAIGGVRGDVSGQKTKITNLETRVAELEQKVKDALENAGMSAADEQEIFNDFAGVRDDIKALDADTPAEEPGTGGGNTEPGTGGGEGEE